MREAIENAGRIALIVHVDPDPDTMGSACAMYAHLLRLQKKVTLFCATPVNDTRLGVIPWSEKTTGRWDVKAELAIAFDCATSARMGVQPHCPLVNVDHHPGNDGYGDIAMLDAGAPSTGSILYGWFKKEGIAVNAKMATALYAALADDTLGFARMNDAARVFDEAAELAKAGADVSAVNEALFRRRPLASLRLKGELFLRLRLVDDARIAVLCADRALFERTGASSEAAEDALDEVLGLPTVRAALLLRVRPDGSVKGSLRAKPGIDVSHTAVLLGGGGHAFAAGFVIQGMPLDEACEHVVTIMKKEMK